MDHQPPLTEVAQPTTIKGSILQARPTLTSPPYPLPAQSVSWPQFLLPGTGSLPSCCHGHEPHPKHTNAAVCTDLWPEARQMQSSGGWGEGVPSSKSCWSKTGQGPLSLLSACVFQGCPLGCPAVNEQWLLISLPCTNFSEPLAQNLNKELSKAVPRAPDTGCLPNTENYQLPPVPNL